MEDNTLNKYWDSVNSENYNNSLKEVENFIRKEAFFGVEKTTSHKSVFITTLSENKIKYTVILASLLIIFITGKVPIKQSKAIGNVVSWSVNKNSDDAISKLDNFRWLDKSNLIVSDTIIDNNQVLNYKMLLPPDMDKSQLALIHDNLREMGDVSGYNIFPIYEPIKRPVYAAALYSLFHIDVSALPENQADIIDNVARQLQIAGLEDDVDIDFRDEDNIPALAYVVPKRDIYSYGIKLHDDIVRAVNVAKSVGNIKKTLENRNMTVNEDSIIKKIVVRLDDQMLKNLSYNTYLYNDNPAFDSIIVKFEKGIKNLGKHNKHIQDSLLNNMQRNIIINVDIPDVEEIINSAMENMDFESLKDMKIKVYDNEELKDELENLKEQRNEMKLERLEELEKLKELDNLDVRIQEEIDKSLNNLDIKIEMNPEDIQKYKHIVDSVKTRMKNLKIEIHNNKENNENGENEEENEIPESGDE